MPLLRNVAPAALAILSLAPAHADQPASLNAQVTTLLREYPEGGFGGYMWPAKAGTHGTTRNIFHGKTRIARAGNGNHCVGITFELMWRALDAVPGARARLTAAQAKRLRYLWFVPVEGGMGPAGALAKYKLGHRVTSWEKAEPGDFIQLWNKDRSLGHSAVFMAWVRDKGRRIVGVRYWSSQPWTGGIGYSEFSIGHNPGDMDPAAVFIARLAPRAP